MTNQSCEPFVSIVTPSYNQGCFIRATIESVLSQDYPHIECWVIDGGSTGTDETLDVLRSFEGDLRFHWISEPDRGQPHAINKGLARCQGEIFNWLCSDDCLTPGALRRVVNAWRANGPSLIYGYTRYIDAKGRDLGRYSRGKPKVSGLYCMPQPSVFLPQKVVKDVGGVDESLHYTADLDLWMRLMSVCKAVLLPYDLSLYRLHDTSKSVFQPLGFLRDFECVAIRAARLGQISSSEALCEVDLFASIIYTASKQKDLRKVFRHAFRSVVRNPLTLPDAIAILTKGVTRYLIGEQNWTVLRRRLVS
mgnify:CR=1 FL=1